MSAQAQNRQPPGRPTGGQFAAAERAEAHVSLGPQPPNAGKLVDGILTELRDRPDQKAYQAYWEARRALQSGTSKEDVLSGWSAAYPGGRCPCHLQERLPHPEDFCSECSVGALIEARANPKPQPVPIGDPPTRPNHPSLEKGPARTEETSDTSSTTFTPLTGDQAFENGIREFFGAAPDTPVTVVQEDYEDWSTYTGEHATAIEVRCGAETRLFDDLGDMMRAMAAKPPSETVSMALRFMRAVDAERPLLQGPAAVYLDQGAYSPPKAVFGRVSNVFDRDRRPFIEFVYIDGRRDYIQFDRIWAIHETDQTSIYQEG